MKKIPHSIKLNSLSIDQKIFGFLNRFFGAYYFSTEDIRLGQYEVKFITKPNEPESLLMVNLQKNKTIVLSLKVEAEHSFKTLKFKIDSSYEFNFIYFCILFKFFYQYIKQYTNYEVLILKSARYKSYLFCKLFGFSILGRQNKYDFLQFNTNESLQTVWDFFYGTSLEENLYNFILPIDAGGYVPGNVKLFKSHEIICFDNYKKTEKKISSSDKPLAEIKVGYDLFKIAICDVSENGLSFEYLMNEDQDQVPHIITNHIYSLWINDPQLKMNWTQLDVQILWSKNKLFGCKILEKNKKWTQFIQLMQVEKNQRLSFKESI